MEIAVSTVLIVLGILPAIVLWNSYFSGRFPRQVFGVSAVSELAQYVVLAVPVDAVALKIIGGYPHALKLDTALRIFTGTAGVDLGQLAAAVGDCWWFTVKAYVMLVIACYLVGNILRRIVWAGRLDVWLPPLRMKQDWYYLLQGRIRHVPRMVFPYADILVAHPDGSRLYRGLVSAFEAGSSGEIKELVLRDTKRGKGRGTEFKWVDVPGNSFVLLGPRIHSINMRYVVVEPPRALWNGFWYQVGAFLQSLFLQGA